MNTVARGHQRNARMRNELTDSAIAAAAQKAAVVGGSTAFLGGLTANELAAFGGLLVGCIGLLIQWYYKRKELRLRKEFYTAQLHRRYQPDDLDEYGA